MSNPQLNQKPHCQKPHCHATIIPRCYGEVSYRIKGVSACASLEFPQVARPSPRQCLTCSIWPHRWSPRRFRRPLCPSIPSSNHSPNRKSSVRKMANRCRRLGDAESTVLLLFFPYFADSQGDVDEYRNYAFYSFVEILCCIARLSEVLKGRQDSPKNWRM